VRFHPHRILAAVGPGIDGRHTAVGVDVAVLAGLLEVQVALVVAGSDDEQVLASGQLAGHGSLARHAEVLLAATGG
jgi:hypothetical protein